MKSRNIVSTVLSTAGLLVVATFAPTAFGQSGTPDQSTPPAASQPAPRAHGHGESLFAGLNLSDDQKAQIKKIHEDARAKADAVKVDSLLSATDKQAKIKEIHRSAMTQARGVLTPEQRQELKAKRRERRAERQQSPSN